MTDHPTTDHPTASRHVRIGLLAGAGYATCMVLIAVVTAIIGPMDPLVAACVADHGWTSLAIAVGAAIAAGGLVGKAASVVLDPGRRAESRSPRFLAAMLLIGALPVLAIVDARERLRGDAAARAAADLLRGPAHGRWGIEIDERGHMSMVDVRGSEPVVVLSLTMDRIAAIQDAAAATGARVDVLDAGIGTPTRPRGGPSKASPRHGHR